MANVNRLYIDLWVPNRNPWDGQIERIQMADDDAACISDKKKSNGGMDHEGDSWTNRGGSRDGQTAGSAGPRAT